LGKVLIGKEAREKILAGAKKLANLVGLTIGPKGRNVVLGNSTIVTNDGVTIARAVKSDDECENLGIEILRQASIKTNEAAGDGTTSAIVLADEILTRANRLVETGSSAVILKNGLLHAADFAVDFADKISKKCGTEQEISAVAINSCANENDGKMIAEALCRVGADGVVIIDENTRGVTQMTVSDGMECPVMLASPYFATESARAETVVHGARVLCFNGQIANISDMVPIMETVKKSGIKLVLIAQDFSPDVIAAVVLNRVRAGLDIVLLRCLRAGESDAVLGDIAAVTGAAVAGAREDLRLCDVEISHLGECEKLISGMQNTTFLGGKNNKIAHRIEQIRAQISECRDEFMTEKLRKRLARLTGGVAVISVGRATPIETHERKLRMDDALMSAAGARAEGIVAGGGAAYIQIAHEIEKHLKKIDPNLREGAGVLVKSLPVILKRICENAGACADVVLQKVRGNRGFDALDGRFVDMFSANIVDPATVIKNVIKNAVSVAATLLTTDGVVV
jgi:chaperonin GroEL